MSIMKIIRIEHPEDGIGWFNSEFGDKHSNYSEICFRHTKNNGFPNFRNDDVLREQFDLNEGLTEDYFFAFKSIEKLEAGFTREELKEIINEQGFQVLMLTVSKWFESEYQVVFRKEDVLEKEDISFMFL